MIKLRCFKWRYQRVERKPPEWRNRYKFVANNITKQPNFKIARNLSMARHVCNATSQEAETRNQSSTSAWANWACQGRATELNSIKKKPRKWCYNSEPECPPKDHLRLDPQPTALLGAEVVQLLLEVSHSPSSFSCLEWKGLHYTLQPRVKWNLWKSQDKLSSFYFFI